MATANVDVKKTLEEYRKVSKAYKEAEDRKAVLKGIILEEIEVRGIPKVKGEKTTTKTLVVDEYQAVVSSYDRESVSLDELVKEFGRDLLKEKKLLNAYPVESLKVTLDKKTK